jgi:hypothetical protein
MLVTEPRLMRRVADLSARKSRFDSKPVRVEFVKDKVALGEVLLQVLLLFPVVVIHSFK